ncbi:hypothetical protein DL766_008351 [Monosporascus sp. MC13-8B]|uniref:Uncharacterized protein n=1 Tax=Monosporascus cannonballus TaxID=155416 RepID=A0ABY0H444_9PEZI|nr:hypothetical protein DL762_005864 [Monosporascus cannonballus]RYO87133.1 hypothetical protein DL763_006487 [Monosporascus cannonballus]RYP19787.1 hypothetical protein DL766_008351 [Monosporascus sp. MC13-8B]
MPETAIISGGARGIGRCLVRRFLERGYRVFVLDIDEEELKHATGTHLKKYSDSGALGSAPDAAGPCIVHVGSFRALQSDPNQAGLLGLMHSMAISLQPQGIRVNVIAPGRIKVAHGSREGDEKGTPWAELNEDKDAEDHPTNRAGRPEDIVDAAEYLVDAGFVTGQDTTVDGGALVKKS